MAGDRGTVVCSDKRAKAEKVRWFWEGGDRRCVNCSDGLDRQPRHWKVGKMGKYWDGGMYPVLVDDLKVGSEQA